MQLQEFVLLLLVNLYIGVRWIFCPIKAWLLLKRLKHLIGLLLEKRKFFFDITDVFVQKPDLAVFFFQFLEKILGQMEIVVLRIF